MFHETVEKLYDTIDSMAMLLVEHANLTYLEALCGVTDNIVSVDVLQAVETEIEIVLYSSVKKIRDINFTAEEIRKAMQLALLKGLKADYIPLDVMTPDGVALIVGYIISKLVTSINRKSVADFVCGTGNLLTAVLGTLQKKPAAIYGADVDYQMLELAKMMAAIQDYEIQFYHQSSAHRMAVPKVDVIIGDLPLETYVDDDEDATTAKLIADGCNFLPYLLVKNHIDYLTAGGYGIYIIGNDFFSHEYAKKFHEILTCSAQIGMLLQLPTEMFKDSSKQKSVLVIRKHSKDSKNVTEMFIANFPNSGNIREFRKMLTKMEEWIILNKWCT